VHPKMRARGDEFGDGGIGAGIVRFGGHETSVTPVARESQVGDVG
jgi:hypothetical protein